MFIYIFMSSCVFLGIGHPSKPFADHQLHGIWSLLLTCAMVKVMIWSMVIPCHGNPDVIAIEIPLKIRFDHPLWWKTTHLLTPWFLNPMPQVPSAQSSAFSPFRYLASHGRHVVPGKLPSGSLWKCPGLPRNVSCTEKTMNNFGILGVPSNGYKPNYGDKPCQTNHLKILNSGTLSPNWKTLQ